MSTTTESKSAFITRFDRIWAQARRVQLSQALCWSVLTALAGVALLAALDYWLELPHFVRLGAIAAIGMGSVVVGISLAVQSVNRWRRQATAAAIEQVFPQLGQRIRTTVQFGPLTTSELEHEGVATTIVTALEDDTIRRAQPLPLDAVIPWKALAVTSMLAAAMGLALAGASATDWQWRAAATRAFLGDEPYTKILVKPGNLTVRDGESATIEILVEGRTGKQVTFATHLLDNSTSDWELQPLTPEEPASPGEQQVKFVVPLTRVREPLEYRVSAGSATSDTYQVKVLYPLKIVKMQSAVQAPEYTGLPEAMVENGNIVGLVGSQAKLTIEIDQAPETAWLEIQDLNRPAKDAPPPDKIPLTIEGVKLTAALELTTDKTYSVFAKSADGMELPENLYRIRVRKDEAPQVWFESPTEALEVHSLAEVLMRIRVSDDFGLSRTGIMFEVNNEEEFPLLAEDFEQAAKELQTTGRMTPKTRATLEKVLPLEHFQLTQQDSVMYFAFAEDNRPNSPQRTESDLRFIDLRPFRRTYRVVDPDETPGMNQGPQLKQLDELIARQRYALNRTIQIERRFKQSAEPDLSGVDGLIKFEAELAKFTRELAEGLEARGVTDTELLYQAETAMLGATDSLSAGKYETATLQERDALKYLIEGRNRLEFIIRKNPDRQQLAQLRNFDRQQLQKLRRPKTDEEEKREVAKRLEELADREEFVYKTLAGIPIASNMKTDQMQDGAGESDQKPMPSTEQPMGNAPTDAANSPMPNADQKPAGGENAAPPDGRKPDAENKPGEKATTSGEKQEGQKPGDQPNDQPMPGNGEDSAKTPEGPPPGDKPGDMPGEKNGVKPGASKDGDQPGGSKESGASSAADKPGADPKQGSGTESPDKEKAGTEKTDTEKKGAEKVPGTKPGQGAADKDQAKGSGRSSGEDPNKDQAGQGGAEKPSARELEDRQLDIAVESRDIEKLLGRLKGVTDLSKERIAAAAKQAEETAKALGNGESDSAKTSAESTGKQFRELADQVKALLAEEQAQRLAAAQQMAASLAQQQEEFVDRLAKSPGNSGKGNPDPKDKKKPLPAGGGKGQGDKPEDKKPEEKKGGAGDKAEEIARQAQTLQDVLKAAATATDPQDEASAKKVNDLIGSLKLDELTQRLENLPNQVGSGQTQEAKATAEDAKERLEAAAEQLSTLQRSIIAPKVDELAKLEAKLAGLDAKLDELETPPDITKWHTGADDLLDDLEKAGISKKLTQEFVDEMKSAGWVANTKRGNWNWTRRAGGLYTAPQAYRPMISRLQDDIRNRIQELMLGDLAFSRDEPVPPQYQELVDRFQQVLATEGKSRPKPVKEKSGEK